MFPVDLEGKVRNTYGEHLFLLTNFALGGLSLILLLAISLFWGSLCRSCVMSPTLCRASLMQGRCPTLAHPQRQAVIWWVDLDLVCLILVLSQTCFLLLQPGDVWTLPDQCHTVTCLPNGQTLLQSHRVNCDHGPRPSCSNSQSPVRVEETCGCRWTCPCESFISPVWIV